MPSYIVDVDHIIEQHVKVSDQESWDNNKGVFNANWLFVIDEDQKKAVEKVALFVVQNGDSAPTANAVDDEMYDFYLNFDKKTGWQSMDEALNIIWYKGVVARVKVTDDNYHVKTMFPKSVLRF